MMDLEVVRDVIARSLRAAGFAGRGDVWRLRGSEVQWVVRIDHPPYGHRLGVDIGLDLQTDSTPVGPTSCPILMHLENLIEADRSAVIEALDLASPLNDSRRIGKLEAAVHALSEYLGQRLTFASVRQAYGAGEFASAFIHKDARSLLEARQTSD